MAKKKIESDQHAIIVSEYLTGKSTTEIAKHFIVSKGTINKILRQHGVALRTPKELNS